MNIFTDKNYPKNGNNYSKETIKSIYNYNSSLKIRQA